MTRHTSISIIVATGMNGAIGKDNQLLWRLSADLKRFKALTTGHTVIMGRKTYDSIGKPLPNRTNIVITQNKTISIAGVTIAHSLEDALDKANAIEKEEIFIIGGAQIYRLALPLTQKIYLTEAHCSPDADAFFEYDKNEWQEVHRESHKQDEKNEFDFSFVDLSRK